ncbi:protein GAMETE EXPRESSED 1-like [Mangifera indica]|uniref:protein GAMETE EXPRESSED 1-like n=1 Tax=Mangifera indica TaxID=29780 RepID=UPI001CFA9252|nr:protein GAMETE EXPRESSED 1-like [Mangifera indica]
MGCTTYLLMLLILLFVSPKCQSWAWFSSGTTSAKKTEDNVFPARKKDNTNGFVAEFSVKSLHNDKGRQLVEEGKGKLVGSNTCWKNAYRHLFAGCSEIIAIEEKRSRFAWHLSDCFQKDSGRPSFPYCDPKSSMINCLKKLDDKEHKIYLAFLLETNSICYQLQAHAFQHETERLVNDLKSSAQYTENKLEIIEEKSETLLQSSNKIYGSLDSIDHRVQSVAQTAKGVQDHIDLLSRHSEAVYQQSMKIASSQAELREGQVRMKEKLDEGMSMLYDAYSNLGEEVGNLRDEAIEVQKQISEVGEAMFCRMENLQKKADDIGSMAGVSLEKQQELLQGQSTALDGLQFLTKFQSEALEESRKKLQELAEYGHKQQEELLKRQEQLQEVHDHLVENSKSILAAQEAFESKQASMFIALDKLSTLQKTMLLESRIIKAFFIYSMTIFMIYMFTSTKQTYAIRHRLYMGLCLTFLIEVAIVRFTGNEIEQQTWIITSVRSLFLILAALQLLHAICTYRDYEVLNHQMLQTLLEKVDGMQRIKELSWESDSHVDWPSWMETELPEDVDHFEDPNYLTADGVAEEVGENWITTSTITGRYNLRSRSKH